MYQHTTPYTMIFADEAVLGLLESRAVAAAEEVARLGAIVKANQETNISGKSVADRVRLEAATRMAQDSQAKAEEKYRDAFERWYYAKANGTLTIMGKPDSELAALLPAY
jgi:hypothetical protein